jgi:hypothetical protein
VQAFWRELAPRQPQVPLVLTRDGGHDMLTWRAEVPLMLRWMTLLLAQAARQEAAAQAAAWPQAKAAQAKAAQAKAAPTQGGPRTGAWPETRSPGRGPRRSQRAGLRPSDPGQPVVTG